ncbi:MAG TPA: hypothetical protein V6D03_08780 [Candidatus Caenarcaniphilales bacterium]
MRPPNQAVPYPEARERTDWEQLTQPQNSWARYLLANSMAKLLGPPRVLLPMRVMG